MVKKTLGYVELEWTCPNCGTRNPGPVKSCSSCGTAQPKRTEFHQGAEEKLITDETEIARAKAGPDVHCACCGARNPAKTVRCTQCGADLSSADARDSGRVLGAHRSGPAGQIACTQCGTLNPATATRCTHCNASLPRTAPDSAPRPPPKPRASTKRRTSSRRRTSTKRRAATKRPATPQPQAKTPAVRKLVTIGIVGLVLIGLIICAVGTLATRCLPSQEITGQVQAVEWTRSIQIEALSDATRENWRADIPRDAELGRCTSKLYRTQDNPAPNATEVCGTPYTVDTGSGYGKVVQDCEYKVYADWCQYKVKEWRAGDKVVARGNDLNVYWPTLSLGSQQREGKREASYRVILLADGQTYTYRTQDVDRFQQCTIGSSWLIRVSALGAVTLVRPAS